MQRLPRKISRKLSRTLAEREALRRDYCFIHINKCGGTSVEKVLGLPKIHDTALQRRDRIGRQRWNRIRKFSVVRNPYAKACSHYRYRVKTGQTGLGDKHLELNDWILRAYGDKDPRYYDKPLMFAPCLDWLVDENGEMMMDLVVKLEEISEGWTRIQQLIGVTQDFPKANATDPGVGSVDLLTPESRAILADHFRKDFETFGYQA